MFSSFFNKRRAGKHAEGAKSALSPASARTQPSTPALPVPVDDAMVAISRELAGLARLPVARAAKERGWAALQRELEGHPVRTTPAHARQPRPIRARSWRWAIGSAAAAVAVIAALIGTYGGGLLQTADGGDQTTTVTSVASSDTTESLTAVVTDVTTAGTSNVSTTGQQTVPSTTEGPSATDGSSTTVGVPTTAQGDAPVTTGGSSTRTTTTRPASTTTTAEQQYAATQREGSARAAVAYLADLVIFGDASGARALVAPQAQASLAQMMMSLNEPHGYRISGVQSLSDTIVRVTLEVSDRVVSPNGELKEALPKFAIRVRVDDKGAVITAINAG